MKSDRNAVRGAPRNIPMDVGEVFENEEVLTVAGVADLLKVCKKTVYRMASQGEIPAKKVRSEWRFLLSQVLEWMRMKGEWHEPV